MIDMKYYHDPSEKVTREREGNAKGQEVSADPMPITGHAHQATWTGPRVITARLITPFKR